MHPICLGLTLTSVFYCEILNNPNCAYHLKRQALGGAVVELDTEPEESYGNSACCVLPDISQIYLCCNLFALMPKWL